jgi:tetratricopeptide (TPR) repeat protein
MDGLENSLWLGSGASSARRFEPARRRRCNARKGWCPALLLGLALGSGCAAAPPAPPTSPAALERQRVEVAHAFVERGRALGAQGDWLRAEQYFQAALAGGAPAAEVVPELVEACIRSERYRAAAQYARDALKSRPEDQRLRFLLATLLVGLGDFGGATRELELLVARGSDRALVHYTLGVLYRDQIRNVERADQEFRHYLRLAPGGVHAQEARGALLTSVVEAKEGQHDPTTYLRTDPVRVLDAGGEVPERPSGE